MANNWTTAEANAALDARFGAGLYLGLSTSDPGSAASLATEISGGSYARAAITWGSAASGIKSNSAKVTFPAASADWNSGAAIGYAFIIDASSGAGNMKARGALTTAKIVLSGETLELEIGELQLEAPTS